MAHAESQSPLSNYRPVHQVPTTILRTLLARKGVIFTYDIVNHPEHYRTDSGLEAIDVIEAFTQGLIGSEATHTGNVLKYMCRWKKKGGLTDLKKAQWYLNRLIEQLEGQPDSVYIPDGGSTSTKQLKGADDT